MVVPLGPEGCPWRGLSGAVVEKRQSIPIGPLWYSQATMPAIGRRSTKPLNDPPGAVVPRPLYFNLGNPAYQFQMRNYAIFAH